MSNAAINSFDDRPTLSSGEKIRFARDVMSRESAAIARASTLLDDRFLEAVDRLMACRGSVIVSGMGKAGLIGRKIAATLASTGTPSHFLHPAEAIHGDLGRIGSEDLCLILSYSGETEEVVRLLPSMRQQSKGVIAITGRTKSSLARSSDVVLELGDVEEACSLRLAPSASTTAMLAMGDALALLVSHLRGFTESDFARYHPGGSLGRKLMKVDEVMRPIDQCRIASSDHSIREVLVAVSKPGRRTGAVMLVDHHKKLVGIFTDSDLAKSLEQRRDDVLDRPIAEVMTTRFQTVLTGSFLPEALQILANRKISELPVVDSDLYPIGLIDITDVVGLMASTPMMLPKSESEQESETSIERQGDEESPTLIPFPGHR